MSAKDELIALLLQTRANLELMNGPIEAIRQYAAQAAGTLSQAGADFYAAQSGSLVIMSDMATEIRQQSAHTIEWLQREIALQQQSH